MKRPLDQDANSETQESHNSEHLFMQPTAKPKPAPQLKPRHSIQDLYSSPHATASSAPHPLAAQPRSAEHAPTLATGAPVGVHMLTHPNRPPPPLFQPKAQPAPILPPWRPSSDAAVTSFPMVCRAWPPVATPCRPQPRSICQAPKPHSTLRHEPSAAPLSPGPSDLESRAQPGRAVAPCFRQAKLGPHAQSQATQREKCIQDWQDLLAQIGSCSITFVAAAASQDPYAAFAASLRAYTPSTIAQYFRCIRAFLALIRALGFSIQNLLLVHLVDLLHACENSKLEDRSSVRIAPRPMLKALSWLARINQIESLASLLSNPLAKAFASPQRPQERKEALPLPLAILASWERKVCAADCAHNLRITLGAFLLAAHTSMRFGDMQRIKIKEISLTCWATKTTKLGQPWACTLFGLTGRSAQSSWVLKWLESLRAAFPR